MLKGSTLFDVVDTFLLFKYFSSILYGCRAPVVRSRVISTAGPGEGSETTMGLSESGPIAVESWRARLVGRVEDRAPTTIAADCGASSDKLLWGEDAFGRCAAAGRCIVSCSPCSGCEDSAAEDAGMAPSSRDAYCDCDCNWLISTGVDDGRASVCRCICS